MSLRNRFRLPPKPLQSGKVFLALCTLLCAGLAHAETYRVDLIVFLNLDAVAEAAQAPTDRSPADGAMNADDRAALAAEGIQVLPESDFALTDAWQRLANSRQFRPLLRMAWTQQNPPRESGPALRLAAGSPQTLNDPVTLSSRTVLPLAGRVALSASRFLHLDVVADWNDGSRRYRMDEKRLMRRDELHHLDSPKLGVLARVSRVENTP